jgi:hypothetical protein
MPTPQIILNTQHVPIGLGRLLMQFKGKPRLEATLAAFLWEGQKIENAAYGLLTRRLDDPNFSGVSMDEMGRIVGQARQGQSDADYLPYLRARILTNFSDGRIETILSLLLYLLGPTTTVLVREYTKALALEVDGVSANAYQVWSQFLQFAKDAGTSLRLVFSKAPASATLKMNSAYGSTFTTTTGQRVGSFYTIGVGGGALAGVFG